MCLYVCLCWVPEGRSLKTRGGTRRPLRRGLLNLFSEVMCLSSILMRSLGTHTHNLFAIHFKDLVPRSPEVAQRSWSPTGIQKLCSNGSSLHGGTPLGKDYPFRINSRSLQSSLSFPRASVFTSRGSHLPTQLLDNQCQESLVSLEPLGQRERPQGLYYPGRAGMEWRGRASRPAPK